MQPLINAIKLNDVDIWFFNTKYKIPTKTIDKKLHDKQNNEKKSLKSKWEVEILFLDKSIEVIISALKINGNFVW